MPSGTLAAPLVGLSRTSPVARATTRRTTFGSLFQGEHKPVRITETKPGGNTFLVTLLNQGDSIRFEPPEGYTPPTYGYPCGV